MGFRGWCVLRGRASFCPVLLSLGWCGLVLLSSRRCVLRACRVFRGVWRRGYHCSSLWGLVGCLSPRVCGLCSGWSVWSELTSVGVGAVGCANNYRENQLTRGCDPRGKFCWVSQPKNTISHLLLGFTQPTKLLLGFTQPTKPAVGFHLTYKACCWVKPKRQSLQSLLLGETQATKFSRSDDWLM